MEDFGIGGGVGVEVESVDFAHVLAGNPCPHEGAVDIVCHSVVYGVAICEI